MATNFTTSGLADYTAADPTKALALYLLEGTGTKDYFSFEDEVKFQKKIPFVSNVNVDISTGAIGGYNTGSGGTTIVDVLLESKQLKIQEDYTKETLNRTILASLGRGTNPEDLPMENVIFSLKGKKIFAENEKLIWQADTSTSVQTAGTTLNSFDGVLAQIAAGSPQEADAAVSFQTLSDASILSTVKSFVSKMETAKPELVTVDTVMAMSPANFAAYSRALYALNGTVSMDTVGADGKPVQEVFVPGTQIKAVSALGLNGKNNIVLTYPENIIAVYDLAGEDESMEFWYNKAAQRHELRAAYKLGAKVVDVTSVITSA